MTILNILHIEATGSDQEVFPMEIGLVLHNGASYCLVTRPEAEGYTVDPQAELETGLSREIREARGRPASEVAQEINAALRNETVYFDARGDSRALLRKVFTAGGITPTFEIEPLQSLLSPEQRRDWEKATATALEEQRQIRNRASDKALILQHTFRLSGA